MQPTTSRKISWSTLKFPFPSRKGKSKRGDKNDDSSKKLNVNEEYKEVFRTQSYAEIWSKVQVQLNGSTTVLEENLSSSSFSQLTTPSDTRSISSPRPFHKQLLEPCQEVAIDIIKSSNLKRQLVDYFNASLDACNLCESLLRGIEKTRSNHQIIRRVIDSLSNNESDSYGVIIRDLGSFARLDNPLSIIVKNDALDFNNIHVNYSLLLRKLLSKGKKIKKRVKFMRFYKKSVGYGFLIAYIVLAIALLAIATHSVVGILAAPGIFMTIPLAVMKKSSVGGDSGSGSRNRSYLEQLASQLDEAARGVYTLINNFDTMGVLVRRVHAEVEHTRVLAEMCVRNKKSYEVVKEALRELCVHENEFVEQLEELEEHIYLCFLTINRSRRSVIKQVISSLPIL